MIINDFFFVTLYQPILNLLVLFYHLLGDNIGFAIIAITVLIKLITWPFMKPSLEFARKQKELAPQLKKLKEKYKNQQVLAQKQMELYKEHGINPAAGCLPQLLPIAIFIVMYNVFNVFLKANGLISENIISALYPFPILAFDPGESLNTSFLIYNLASIDKTYTLPLISAALQFYYSKAMQKQTKAAGEAAKSTPDTKDDFMYNMQEGMIYSFPLVTFFIGISLPAGLSLYWIVSTFVSIVQYLILNKDSVKTNTIKESTNGSSSTPK